MRTIILILALVSFVSCGKEEKKVVNDKTEKKSDTVQINNKVSSIDSISVKIKEKLSGDLYKKDLAVMTEIDRKFRYKAADLNSDGKDEYFIAFSSPYFCGTGGCTVVLLNNDFSLKNTFSVVDYPINILNSKTDGWNDLVMLSGSKKHLVKHDKKGYPENPSVQPVFNGSIDKDSKSLFDESEKTETFAF